jgi:hypothetical protein
LIFAVATLVVSDLFFEQRKQGKKGIILGIATGVLWLVFLICAVSSADGIVMLILTLFVGLLYFLFTSAHNMTKSKKSH